MLASDIAPDLARATDILVRDYCAVKSDESVLITADTHTDMTVVAAALNAANNVGAKSVVNVVPRMPFQGGLSNPYIAEPLAAAIAASDVWIDFMFPNIAGSDAYEHAIKRVRYVMCGDVKPDSVVRMFGRVDLDRLYDVHRSFIDVTNKAVGKEARIINDRGSDVTFELGKLPFPKPRRAEKPGLYTVPGAMGLWPVPDKVKGYIVVDCCFHEYYAQLTPPLKIKIDGRIKEIAGGGPERKVMDRALRRAANGNYGKVIHFTVGAQPAARFTGQSFIEDQRVMGNNAVGLGTPFWEKGGGENHPDAVLSQQSVWIDGTQIVKDGVIVGPPKLKKYADKLQPLYA
jgi:leucyl aminopeptidase (aminopeptidase T)